MKTHFRIQLSSMNSNKNNGNPWNALIGVAVIVIFMAGLFMMARMVFRLLYFLTPLMLIAALIINYKVVTGYVNWLVRLFRRDTLAGIGVSVLSILGLPVLSAFFLIRALAGKQVKKAQQDLERRRDGDLVDFEELESDFPLRWPKKDKATNDDQQVK
jgi:hypothetical protein